MKKFSCIRIKGNNTLCQGIPRIADEGPFYYYCEECGEESVSFARPIEALKNWNYKNRFPEWYKERVLEAIMEDNTVSIRSIIARTRIPEIFVKRILQDLKEKGLTEVIGYGGSGCTCVISENTPYCECDGSHYV